MRKGRHRRFEEARALKRSTEVVVEPCPECGADPEDEHASWCLATEDDDDEIGYDDPSHNEPPPQEVDSSAAPAPGADASDSA